MHNVCKLDGLLQARNCGWRLYCNPDAQWGPPESHVIQALSAIFFKEDHEG
jgi:hypothetical protein